MVAANKSQALCLRAKICWLSLALKLSLHASLTKLPPPCVTFCFQRMESGTLRTVFVSKECVVLLSRLFCFRCNFSVMNKCKKTNFKRISHFPADTGVLLQIWIMQNFIYSIYLQQNVHPVSGGRSSSGNSSSS